MISVTKRITTKGKGRNYKLLFLAFIVILMYKEKKRRGYRMENRDFFAFAKDLLEDYAKGSIKNVDDIVTNNLIAIKLACEYLVNNYKRTLTSEKIVSLDVLKDIIRDLIIILENEYEKENEGGAR